MKISTHTGHLQEIRGISSSGGMCTFSAIIFKDNSRLHNVVIPDELNSKLQENLNNGFDCEIHYIKQFNENEKIDKIFIISVQGQDSINYIKDYSQESNPEYQIKLYKRNKLLFRLLGFSLIAIGLPLSIFIIGLPALAIGIYLAIGKNKIMRSLTKSIELTEILRDAKNIIPNSRYI